jgi:hypothetical protein
MRCRADVIDLAQRERESISRPRPSHSRTDSHLSRDAKERVLARRYGVAILSVLAVFAVLQLVLMLADGSYNLYRQRCVLCLYRLQFLASGLMTVKELQAIHGTHPHAAQVHRVATARAHIREFYEFIDHHYLSLSLSSPFARLSPWLPPPCTR